MLKFKNREFMKIMLFLMLLLMPLWAFGEKVVIADYNVSSIDNDARQSFVNLFIDDLSGKYNYSVSTVNDSSLPSYWSDINKNGDSLKDAIYAQYTTPIPRIDALRIGGELIVGMVLGIGTAASFVYITGLTFSIIQPTTISQEGPVGLALILSDVGFVLGSTLGVYLIGNLGNETGSFLETLLFASIGNIATIAFIALLPSASMFVFVAPAIGSVMGFNRTRRYKSQKALLNLNNGNFRIECPQICSDVTTKSVSIKLFRVDL